METPNYRKASIYFDDETVLEVEQKGGGGSGVGGELGLKARNLVTGEETVGGSQTVFIQRSSLSQASYTVGINTSEGFSPLYDNDVDIAIVRTGNDLYLPLLRVGIDAETGNPGDFSLITSDPSSDLSLTIEGDVSNYEIIQSPVGLSPLTVYVLHIMLTESDPPSVYITL